MSINTYDIGDVARVSAAFTDVNDAAADPSTVSLAFKDPSENVTTYIYGTDAEVVKDSTGNYHVDIALDEAGTWHYRWVSTGTGATAQEGELVVKPRKVF